MSKKLLQTSGLVLGLGLLFTTGGMNLAKANLVVEVPEEYFDQKVVKIRTLWAGLNEIMHPKEDQAAGKISEDLTTQYPALNWIWDYTPWGDRDHSHVSMVLVPQDKNKKHQEVNAREDMWPAYPKGTTVGYVLNNSTLKLAYDKETGKYTFNVVTPAPQPQAQN